MTAMPHTRRRRREKKLMTMDEVNERFPLLKYKAWTTTRAEKGLPTAGGVTAPSGSRAASLRNVEGTIPPSSSQSDDNQRPHTAATKLSTDRENDSLKSATQPEMKTSSEEQSGGSDGAKGEEAKSVRQEEDASTLAPTRTNDSDVHPDDLDDDDQIHMAVPTEMMANPGDSCAICIDTLEDDDDVRGLTCGHAFHASCLDPWLTARRACCPLCKADYYIPKPRPEGEVAADAERQPGHPSVGPRMDAPPAAHYPFVGHRQGRPRMLLPGRFMAIAHHDDNMSSQYGMPNRRHLHGRRNQAAPHSLPPPPPPPAAASVANAESRGDGRTWRSRFTPSVPRVRMPALFRRNNNHARDTPTGRGASGINCTSTPSQLEAAQR